MQKTIKKPSKTHKLPAKNLQKTFKKPSELIKNSVKSKKKHRKNIPKKAIIISHKSNFKFTKK
jgi:hypothetical protein